MIEYDDNEDDMYLGEYFGPIIGMIKRKKDEKKNDDKKNDDEKKNDK